MAKKALIFGSGGQLGVELVREFSSRGWQVTARKRGDVDITDSAQVEQAIATLAPDVVLNSAAYNQVDLAEREPQAALLVNALAVRNLALACRQTDALLVHFSTDYVFDGAAGRSYVETDAVHPLGAYAVSKLAGELYAQAYLDRPLIVRTSGVFGPGALYTATGNFIETMLRLARERGSLQVVEDHVASPTYSPALASRTADLVEKGLRGVFHIGGGTPISWFDYAKLIFRLAGLSPQLKPTDERQYRTAARRPKYSALSNAKMEAAGLHAMPTMEAAVASYLEQRQRLMPVTA
jgi:dTDP-4-dehydrorhamnose reductase